MISHIWQHRLFRYILAGGVSYAVELGLILSLVYLLSLGYVVAVAIAFWVGLLIAFVLQKVFAFSSKTTRRQNGKQLTQYLALVGINYIFTIGFVALFSEATGVAIARTVALIITTVWNFVIYNKIIFRHEKNS